jgi:hypothetical protein
MPKNQGPEAGTERAMKITDNAVWNAEESETVHWNRYRRALKESSDAFKAWQKSADRLRAAIRAGERNKI